jgi:hypothetical protein
MAMRCLRYLIRNDGPYRGGITKDPKGSNLYILPARRDLAIRFNQRHDAYRRLRECSTA